MRRRWGPRPLARRWSAPGWTAPRVGETIMGCVLQAGQGQAPARQAARAAGIPDSVGATTVNKMCGSGMRAAMFGHDAIAAGATDIVIAGGLESMTNAPYLLPRARGGLRMGHGEVKDHMFLDGLEDAYDRGKLMGDFAENTAEKYQFSREEQDEFAIRSSNAGAAPMKTAVSPRRPSPSPCARARARRR